MSASAKNDWVMRLGAHPLFRQRPVHALALAVATVTIAISVRLALGSYLPGFPFLTLFPAVVICTFSGGWQIGVATTFLSALAADYFLLSPINSFYIVLRSDALGLAGFVIVSLGLVFLTHVATRTAEANAALAEQRQVLLIELQHRIKNHLQLLGAMLATHAKAATNDRIRQRLLDAGQRLQVMAATYDNLYEPGALIDMRDHLRKICEFVQGGVASTDAKIELDAVETRWPVEKVVPLSLIVNELLTNAVKHSTENAELSISVKLERQERDIRLSVLTRNVALPSDFQLEGSGLGLRIAGMLARQLGGTLTTPDLPKALFAVEFRE
jgi:two-component sensor histidine kinase